MHLATAEMYIDRFARAGEHAARALQIGRATGQGALFPLIFVMLGTAHWVQGRIAESAAVFDDAIDQARTLENVQGLAWNLFNRSFAATAAGDVEIALAAATESIEVAKRLDDSLIRAHGAWALAFPLLETGKAEEAAELLISSTGGEEMRLIPGGWRTYGLELLTRCLLAAGRPADAERAVAAATACADEYRLPMARGIAARARATLLLDRGDATAAAVEARTSAEALEDVGCVYDAAISRSLAGRALTAAGDREQGADELERAAAAFESYGSKRQLARAEHELRRLGRRFQARSKPGDADAADISALSERELEVARLIVDRKTNPADRNRAVPQRQDGRDAHPQHVPQARRQLARRARARRRGVRPRGRVCALSCAPCHRRPSASRCSTRTPTSGTPWQWAPWPARCCPRAAR